VPGKTKREIEIKLPVKDLPETVRRLRRMGATHHGRVFEQNALYDTPDGALRGTGRLLRVRVETSPDDRRRGLLTSKAPLPQIPRGRTLSAARHKERLEREVVVRDPSRTDQFLRAIGFRPTFCYQKYRTSFRLRGLHLDLDETPLGAFLELEGRPVAIDRVARALGYSSQEYFRGTYWDLYAADCRRRGKPIKNMLFGRKNFRKRALFA
jgi:adenylate cyclase, class 2